MHPRFQTPTTSTIAMGVASVAFYVGLVVLSGNVLADSIASLGLLIAFYYAMTGYACAWHFRDELTRSARDAWVKGVLPLVGALILTLAFVKSAKDMYAADYGATSFHGVGGVFLLGVGSLLLGVLVMLVCEASDRTFFRRESSLHAPVARPGQRNDAPAEDLSSR